MLIPSNPNRYGLLRQLLVPTAFAFVLSLGTTACSKGNEQGPVAAPAVDQAGFAARYPDELARLRRRLADQESRAQTSMGTFGTFPDEIDKPNWDDVGQVYEAASVSGQRSDYADGARDAETVTDFFDQEKGEISMKVAGAANYAAKQKSCTVDMSGTTTNALEKSVEKQIEKRLRAHNDAHRIIDEREDSLGKPNREKLEKQADEIANASYLTYVGMEETRRELVAMVDAGNDAKGTLDNSITEARAMSSAAGRTDAEKKKATARAEAAEAAKAKIDTEIEESKKLLEGVEQRQKTLKEQYEKAFAELKQKVDAKKSGATPAS
jgi:hypothetical protein